MTPRLGVALGIIAVLTYAFAVVLPRRAERRLAALRARIARDPGARFRFYLRYLAFGAISVVAYAVTVALGGEGFAVAGAAWPDRAVPWVLGGVYTGIVVAGGIIGLTRAVGGRFDPAAFDTAKQFERVEFLVPDAPRERAVWGLVSLAIGVAEELVYRGLFVLYAAALLGVSPWWLVLPSSVVFALNHRYQGWFGVVATGALGLGFAIMTVMAGSLWPAIVLHAAFDYRLKYVRRRLARTDGHRH